MESGHLNILTEKTVAFLLTVSEDGIAEQLHVLYEDRRTAGQL